MHIYCKYKDLINMAMKEVYNAYVAMETQMKCSSE